MSASASACAAPAPPVRACGPRHQADGILPAPMERQMRLNQSSCASVADGDNVAHVQRWVCAVCSRPNRTEVTKCKRCESPLGVSFDEMYKVWCKAWYGEEYPENGFQNEEPDERKRAALRRKRVRMHMAYLLEHPPPEDDSSADDDVQLVPSISREGAIPASYRSTGGHSAQLQSTATLPVYVSERNSDEQHLLCIPAALTSRANMTRTNNQRDRSRLCRQRLEAAATEDDRPSPSAETNNGSGSYPLASAWKCSVCRRDNASPLAVCSACGSDRSAEDEGVESSRPHVTTSREKGGAAKTLLKTPSAKQPLTVVKRHYALAEASSPSLRNAHQRTRSTRSPSPPRRSRTAFVRSLWPHFVERVRQNFNPLHVRFEYESPFPGLCGCADPCRHYTCRNGKLGIFCTENCCPYKGNCGNALHELDHLQLTQRPDSTELAVVAGEPIDAGHVIGEYIGEVVVKYKKDVRGEGPVSTSAYRLKLKRRSWSHPGAVIYIDAQACGGITRFLNHSCDPAARFHEVRNGDVHTVVVVALRTIPAGQEITVDYGGNLWFVCKCGEPTCRHKHLNQ